MLSLNKYLKLSNQVKLIQEINRLSISTSSKLEAGKIWRQSVGLSKLQTARGPLIDLPDYSFTDGRPTPLSVGQLKRNQLQNRLANEVMDCLKYLNQAKQILKKESSHKK